MIQARYRNFSIENERQLLELFDRVPPTIARISNKLVYKAIINDALKCRQVYIFVALVDDTVAGYSIIAWNWNRFKKLFLLRHPLVCLVAVVAWLRRRIVTPNSSAHNLYGENTHGYASPVNPISQSWNDSTQTIAKVVYTGIDPQIRSIGIGRGLYATLITHLKKEGFTRLDAHIELDNRASIQMHKKAGWTMIPEQHGFFAFIEFGPERRSE